MTDIAKILENAPNGIKLYSPAYGYVELEEAKNTPYCDGTSMTREIKTKSLYSRKSVSFDYMGRLSVDGECMLFPGKDGTNWGSWQKCLMPQSEGSYVVDCYGGVFRVRESGWSLEDSGGNVFEMSPEDYCKGGDGFRYATKEEIDFFENNEKKNKRTIIKCDDADNALDSKWWLPKPFMFNVGDVIIPKGWTCYDKGCEKYLITNIDEYCNYATLNLLTNNNKWFSRAFAEEKLRKWTPFDMKKYDIVTRVNAISGEAEWIGIYDKMDSIQIETFNFFEVYNIISDCFHTSEENYPAYATATDKDDFNHIRPSTESEKELFLKEYAKFFGLDSAYDYFIIHIGEKYNVVDSKYHIVSDIWFDWVWDFNEGFAMVELNNRCNFINKEGKLLSPQWFDCVDYFSEGLARVKLNNKWNFINTEGKIISQQWFDMAWSFYEGFAMVKLNGKGWNFINQEGKLLSQQWFDDTWNFDEGFARVKLNNKYYYLNTQGQLCDSGTKEVLNKECASWITQDFDSVGDFKDGFARVELNGKYNYINQEGKLLSPQWFDVAWGFIEGLAIVCLNNKGWDFINKEGKLLSPKWFDWVGYFSEGFARVELNDKFNYINKEGKYLSKQWFEDVCDFEEGFAAVKLNNKWFRLNHQGLLCDYDTKEVLSASINAQEDSFNNWSIRCAQPGDVLSSKHYVFIYKGINPNDHSVVMSFCDCRKEKDIYLTVGLGPESDRICCVYECKPATQEEKDLLFKLIKES